MELCRPWISLGWSEAASIATVFAAVIALWVYAQNARSTRLSHMHNLFTDYLRMSFDYTQDQYSNPESRAQLASFRMYSMEEMYLWLKREKWTFSYASSIVAKRFSKNGYRDALDSWHHTIVSHLSSRMEETGDRQAEETARNLIAYEQCYTQAFCRFCLKMPDVKIEFDRLRAEGAGQLSAPTSTKVDL